MNLQARKSARTRQRILDATLDCLIERGYARTSTNDIVARAGVSRGAMLHHFPSRNELFVAAIEHISRGQLDRFRDAVTNLPEAPAARIDQAIELVWESFSQPAYAAILELGIAARHEPELAEGLRSAARRFEQEVAEVLRDLFASAGVTEQLLDLGQLLVNWLMHGMALSRLIDDRPDQQQTGLEVIRTLARQALASPELLSNDG
ncbi:MAG: TetR/AcrR family transcriptional regulator [Candidatus Dadabacteria bacterium]|nr:MAG: TetR/AcrR family transcriptional regulator [Candidatus Dadabacteria bacterium]